MSDKANRSPQVFGGLLPPGDTRRRVKTPSSVTMAPDSLLLYFLRQHAGNQDAGNRNVKSSSVRQDTPTV